jgi:hypothetical protein
MSMPAQGAVDIPLSNIVIQGDSVRFNMLSAPGTPVLEGKLSSNGLAISGTFSASGQSIPFELKRTGEGAIKPPAPSTTLTKEFEGSWEGALDTGSQKLRIALKLTRGADGIASGVLTSLDQNNAEIPITTITQKENRLDFQIPAVNGAYSGTLSGDGSRITGNWTQAGEALPLVFTKAGKPADPR